MDDQDTIRQVHKETTQRLGLPESTSTADTFKAAVNRARSAQGLPPLSRPANARIIVYAPKNDN